MFTVLICSLTTAEPTACGVDLRSASADKAELWGGVFGAVAPVLLAMITSIIAKETQMKRKVNVENKNTQT
jgi:hypothetical protein